MRLADVGRSWNDQVVRVGMVGLNVGLHNVCCIGRNGRVSGEWWARDGKKD